MKGSAKMSVADIGMLSGMIARMNEKDVGRHVMHIWEIDKGFDVHFYENGCPVLIFGSKRKYRPVIDGQYATFGSVIAWVEAILEWIAVNYSQQKSPINYRKIKELTAFIEQARIEYLQPMEDGAR